MGGLITDEEITQYMIEVVQEEDEESTDGTLEKPTTDETRKALDTLVKFLMFTESSKIGTMAMKLQLCLKSSYTSPSKSINFGLFISISFFS